MADTDIESVIPFIDGDGKLQFQLVLKTPFRTIAPESTIRANGAVVDDTNPFPVQVPPAASSYSSVAEASHLLKGSPGVLSAIQCNAPQTGWFLLLDVAALPANGAVAPRRAWYFSSAETTLDRTFNPPLQMANGAVLAFSTTGPFLLTLAGAVAQFSGEIV